MTPESIMAADIIDRFESDFRARFLGCVKDLAEIYKAGGVTESPVQLGFRYSEPGSNLILGPWGRPSPVQRRKPPKKAPRLKLVTPAGEPGPVA